jgi:hypothetical protein
LTTSKRSGVEPAQAQVFVVEISERLLHILHIYQCQLMQSYMHVQAIVLCSGSVCIDSRVQWDGVQLMCLHCGITLPKQFWLPRVLKLVCTAYSTRTHKLHSNNSDGNRRLPLCFVCVGMCICVRCCCYSCYCGQSCHALNYWSYTTVLSLCTMTVNVCLTYLSNCYKTY